VAGQSDRSTAMDDRISSDLQVCNSVLVLSNLRSTENLYLDIVSAFIEG